MAIKGDITSEKDIPVSVPNMHYDLMTALDRG